jgi:uncharacterized protein Yka (UPF0111/DUF47 family)
MTGRLAPSGRRFLPELSMIAELAVAAAGIVRDRLRSRIGLPHHAADLAAHAREADQIAATVTTGAPHALVPPIDGEDATALAWRLRGVVDAARGVGRLADTIGPDLADERVARLADLLVQAADSLEGAVATLTDRFRTLDFATDVRRLRREGDRAYAEAMGALLAAAPEPIGAVRQAEMYRTLRESLRACARAAAFVERIALKRF